MNRPALAPDFSLVLGGPLYQLWRGTHLADDTLHLLHRRMRLLIRLITSIDSECLSRRYA